MSQTQQAAAISFYQQVASIQTQMLSLLAQIKPLLTANTDQSYATVLSNFPTGAQSADGSIGAADGSPNVAHPITIPLGAPLNKSANQFALGLQNMVDYVSLMENVAVGAAFRRAFAQALQ